MGPYMAPYPPGVPTRVAPTRRVVHPTRYLERHRVIRYPIKHVYPTHVHHVTHHVCEHYCCDTFSESYQDCYHNVNVNCGPRGPRPFYG
ncbi:hypothetical protein J2S00_001666 [Caldalkalibacillus uzonensis]|uniref:Spore coat protein D n=1 Tax=Caldalkalibacillus uzonensis TaxID=353224 RepID=A0ABU0CTP5_9BACI|nr:CotD family spore coat protein [Caldalkalibacillus uzonensis]MDQ0338880.1 hypothetical protein [Caldalkalibacillus uzonensis]